MKAEGERPNHGASLFGAVYMSEFTRIALLGGEKSTFPAGSLIVREKLLTPTSITPEVLSVMIKREPGFNPDFGDWEFLVVDGSVENIQSRQTRGECLGCHFLAKDKDFVFRTY